MSFAERKTAHTHTHTQNTPTHTQTDKTKWMIIKTTIFATIIHQLYFFIFYLFEYSAAKLCSAFLQQLPLIFSIVWPINLEKCVWLKWNLPIRNVEHELTAYPFQLAHHYQISAYRSLAKHPSDGRHRQQRWSHFPDRHHHIVHDQGECLPRTPT